MNILQLDPSIPLMTPKGPGLAWLVIDYGPEHNIFWTVAIDGSGEIWTFANPDVRAQQNISVGRILAKNKKSVPDTLEG